jgi:DNA-directed RNA polymerase subunit M/transcription elongation factor TFIIS
MSVDHRELERRELTNCLSGYAPFWEFDFDLRNWCVKTIERSIYNATVDKAKEKGIRSFWSEADFVAIYDGISANLRENIDIDSNINSPHVEEIRTHVANKICEAMKFRIITEALGAGVGPGTQYIERMRAAQKIFDLAKIGYYSSLTLNPAINRPYIEQLQIRNSQETVIRYSKMYLCVCGERKTKTYELQTRSLDEGGTLFIQCLSCHRVWTSRH